MKIQARITPSVLQAAVALLSPYVPEISPQGLVDALKNYHADGRIVAAVFEKPMTQKETAELLGVSMPTINRLLNKGVLKRIPYSKRCVKVDAESIRVFLKQGNMTIEV